MTPIAEKLAATACGLAALLACAGVFAQGRSAAETDAERCAKIEKNPDLAIQHCTRAIDSKKFSGSALSRLHLNRGLELATKGQHERATEDFDTAIRLDPKFAPAYHSRGESWSNRGDSERALADFDAALRLAPREKDYLVSRAFEWMVKGDYPKAVADYDTALKLDPKSPLATFGRGRAHFYSGDYARAVTELENAQRLSSNAYNALWLYLARKRAGSADAETLLVSAIPPEERGAWPWPVIALFVGRTDANSVMAAASDRDAARQREQRCEANFYLAHWHLMQNERGKAAPLLEEARSGCPKDVLEYEGSVAELRRVKPN